VTPRKAVGDVDDDGSVDAVDALLILQFHARLLASLPNPGSADVNADGRIDSLDAKLVLQYVAGLIHELPPR
jgi:hypothetical protein